MKIFNNIRAGFSILLVFTTGIILSQTDRVERALDLLLRSQPKDKTAYALNDSCFELRFSDPQTGLRFARYGLNISQDIASESLQATSLFNIGTSFHIIGTYDSAMHYYQEAEKLFSKKNDPKAMGTVYLQIGLLFSDSYDNKSAIDYTNKSLSYYYKAHDTINIIGAYFNLAVFHGNMDTVLHYQARGLNLLKGFVNIPDKLKAMKLSIAYTNFGNSYQKLKKFNEAVYYYKLAIAEDEKHDDLLYKIGSYENLGSCYQNMNEPRKAISILRKAINEGAGVQGYRSGERLYNSLSLAYEDIGRFDSAYFFMKEYSVMIDSIYSSENQRVITEMQQKYDHDKKEAEIELLNKDKEAAASFKRTLYIIISLILIVVIALVYSYLQKQRSNKSLVIKNEEIHLQKKVIEEKQREILDSIRYARRIQQSLMPTSKYIDKKLEDLKK